MQHEKGEFLFQPDRDAATETAWACVVYSAVPYLGILFLPFGFFFGARCLFKAGGPRQTAGINSGAKSLLASASIMAFQIILWWLLFMLPEWAAINGFR